MKLHVVLDHSGQIVAAQEAVTRADGDAGLIAGPGQRLHELEVPRGVVLNHEKPDQFQQELTRLVKARPAQ